LSYLSGNVFGLACRRRVDPQRGRQRRPRRPRSEWRTRRRCAGSAARRGGTRPEASRKKRVCRTGQGL